MKKLSILLILALLCSLCACGKEAPVAVQEPAEPTEAIVPEALPTDAPVVVTEGVGIRWDFADDTLTLTGEGNMEDYELFSTPWDQAGKSFSVKKLIVGEGIRYLGQFAFAACCNLEEVTLPASLRHIGESCFADCAALKTLTLPEGLMRMDANAFTGCGLTELRFPSTLAEIGAGSFANCVDLQKADLDRNLLTVGEDAFSGCPVTLSVPGGCRAESALGGYTLVSGTPLADASEEPFAWSGEGWALRDGVLTVSELTDYTATGGDAAPWSCLTALVERIELAEGITHIGDYSFWSCSGCRSVSIPEGVASIGDYAFGACAALEELKLPSTLKSIGYGSFSFCSSLTSLKLPEGLESVGADAFVLCTGLSAVEKPASLTKIGAGAFNFAGENTGELVE